jgi:hypothetical protein
MGFGGIAVRGQRAAQAHRNRFQSLSIRWRDGNLCPDRDRAVLRPLPIGLIVTVRSRPKFWAARDVAGTHGQDRSLSIDPDFARLAVQVTIC